MICVSKELQQIISYNFREIRKNLNAKETSLDLRALFKTMIQLIRTVNNQFHGNGDTALDPSRQNKNTSKTVKQIHLHGEENSVTFTEPRS